MTQTTVTKEQVISFIENLTLLEAKQLVAELKERLGISDMPVMGAMPVGVAAPAAAGAAAQAPAEEKSEFTVVITAVGDKKVNVIKEVKNITGLGLKEAKDLVENLPAKIKENLSKKDAEALKKQLEDAGATVELK